MEFSIRRVSALLKKEIEDISKNINVLMMYMFSIVFSIIFSKMIGGNVASNNEGKIYMFNLSIDFSIAMIASFVMALLIAEEKEKNTLRTLMISGVSPLEFFTGKALITFVATEIINIVIFFIFKMNVQYFGAYILLTTLVVFSMIGIGGIIGIIAPNQMATGVVGTPVLMVIMMIPMFAKANKTLTKIAELLPNYNMNVLVEKVFKGETIGVGSVYNIVVMVVWIIITAATFAYSYSKIGIDK